MLLYYLLLVVFVIGAIVGSFLNVAIARLPLEKSMLWPGSRCGNCYQRIRWYDNLPLVSYFWLRGRCRICGASFSIRYFLVELATALGFVGLFYFEMILNVHQWPDLNLMVRWGFFPWQWWVGYLFHAILFSFLMVASVCDLAGREIPFSLTLTGAIVGLIGAVLMPWPWPSTLQAAVPCNPVGGEWLFGDIGQGIYAWPVWGPLPSWLPGGSWQMGLATGLVGFLTGTLMLRAVGFLFSKGLGKEALGLGDADLMMMAGCFLGWQIVAVAFFISVVPALVFGLVQYFIHRDNELPFGPSLAAGLLITMLGWHWIGKYVQFLFFFAPFLIGLSIFAAIFMLVSSYAIRKIRRDQPEEAPPATQEPAAANNPGPLNTMKKILIVDYGMANLRSVQKAFEKVGYAAEITSDPNRLKEADKLVLPGVGAFRDAIARLREADFVTPILEHIRAGKPFLGICLGLQLLFTKSYEDGEYEGLNLFPGEVIRFAHVDGLKVPHMGWNQLRIVRAAPALRDLPGEPAVYFTHSYYVVPKDPALIATETDYPTPFTSAIWHENVFATQFHPEKSQRVGLTMLRNFADFDR